MIVIGGTFTINLTVSKSKFGVGSGSVYAYTTNPNGTTSKSGAIAVTGWSSTVDGTATVTADKTVVGLYRIDFYRDADTDIDNSATLLGTVLYNVVSSDTSITASI